MNVTLRALPVLTLWEDTPVCVNSDSMEQGKLVQVLCC